VRIETYNEGLRGSLKDSSALNDYNAGWKSQIRLKGVMKYSKSTYVNETTQYGDVSHNALKHYKSEQVPKYVLSLRPVPGWMDFIISTNILQADQILITDYNDDNRHPFIKHPVINDGEMAPSDNNLRNSNSSIDINLSYGLNNLRRRNSY
jgi:hypothetical protein